MELSPKESQKRREEHEEDRETAIILLGILRYNEGDFEGRDERARQAYRQRKRDAKKRRVESEKQKNLKEYREWQDHLKCKK